MFVIEALLKRLRQGSQTMRYPAGAPPSLPDRHGGSFYVMANSCPAECNLCAEICPTEAIAVSDGSVVLDLGRCTFCAGCVEACRHHVIRRTNDHRMATRSRGDLLLGKRSQEEVRLASAFEGRMRSIFGRSLRLRQVSAGGCNACEADTNVLNTIGWDIGRFGIQFVASPRHADGLLITGPVSRNMELALRKTYNAVPDPRIVIAVGACAISGGSFAGSIQVLNGAASVVPVDLYIPGCPPHPLTILDGLLRLLDRLPRKEQPPVTS